MRKIDTIVIHCSATKDGESLTVNQLRDMHVNGRGWSDIGYHFYIRRNGQIEKGRPVAKTGAHVKGHNTGSIGICYEGGLDYCGEPKDTRTDEQHKAMQLLISILQHTFSIIKICGHRDLSPDTNGNGKVDRHEWLKECPCFDAWSEYA